MGTISKRQDKEIKMLKKEENHYIPYYSDSADIEELTDLISSYWRN